MIWKKEFNKTKQREPSRKRSFLTASSWTSHLSTIPRTEKPVYDWECFFSISLFLTEYGTYQFSFVISFFSSIFCCTSAHGPDLHWEKLQWKSSILTDLIKTSYLMQTCPDHLIIWWSNCQIRCTSIWIIWWSCNLMIWPKRLIRCKTRGRMSTVFWTMLKKTAIIVPGGFPQLSNDDNSV